MIRHGVGALAVALTAFCGNAARAQNQPAPLTSYEQGAVAEETLSILTLGGKPCAGVLRGEVYEGVPSSEGTLMATRERVVCTDGNIYGLVSLGERGTSIARWTSLASLFSQAGPTTWTGPLATSWPHEGSLDQTALRSGIALARAILTRALLDYETARFAEVRAVKVYERVSGVPVGNPQVGFCGKVNSKNGFGAYGGWTTFYVAPGFRMDFGLANGEGIGALTALRSCETTPLARWSGDDLTASFQP